MEEILHHLICNLSHYLQGLYIPGGAGFLPSTVVWVATPVFVCFFLRSLAFEVTYSANSTRLLTASQECSRHGGMKKWLTV